MYLKHILAVSAFTFLIPVAVIGAAPKTCPAGKSCYCSFGIPTGKTTKQDGSILKSGCFESGSNKVVETYTGSSDDKIEQKCMTTCLKLDMKKAQEFYKSSFSPEAKKVLQQGPAKF